MPIKFLQKLCLFIILLGVHVVLFSQTNQWTWVGGTSKLYALGVYGIKGQASTNNIPGARAGSNCWTDNQGHLWMFGGYGYGGSLGSGNLSDLWRYDLTEGTWTWVSGNSLVNILGYYGPKGQPSSSYRPGARHGSISWSDSQGGLWMFGGYGYKGNGSSNLLNDLWRFDVNGETWTWVSGSSVPEATGIYGTQGLGSVDNQPGARMESVSWTDSQGRFWLFGGTGNSGVSYYEYFNDLWLFDPKSGKWTWMGGSSGLSARGVYGTVGQASAGNRPGARHGSISWTDSQGLLWMFGGNGYSSDREGILNDLWCYNTVTGMWTWISGSTTTGAIGVYGTQGQALTTNSPGARVYSTSWTDNQGRLWLFGGYGIGHDGYYGKFNDLWRFDPGARVWTWVSGSKTRNVTAVYGTLGQTATSNSPGARGRTLSWTDSQDRLWMFGGNGYNSTDDVDLNDLWRFDPDLPTAPSLTITTPADNSYFPEQSTISTIAFAINPSGTIHYVDFFEQDTKVETDSTKPYALTRTNVPAGTYRVSAIAITNLADTLRSDTITINVIAACTPDGTIYGEGYTNIPGGTVFELSNHHSYPNNPSVTGQLPTFEYKDVGDNYGGRLRGYLCVPQTGFYTFYISGDDQAGLWFSTDENPANKQLIAYATIYTGFRQWNKFPTQQSQPVYLVAGARYYVETLHKEAVDRDHLSVAWKLPDGQFEGPIPGKRLSPFDESGGINTGRIPMNFEEAMGLQLDGKLQLKVLPNPSRSNFTINVEGVSGTPVQLTVTDILGRRVEQLTNLQANTIMQLGQKWMPGIYILQVQQGSAYKIIKLVKE